jgi:hypothetical protein
MFPARPLASTGSRGFLVWEAALTRQRTRDPVRLAAPQSFPSAELQNATAGQEIRLDPSLSYEERFHELTA